VGEAMRGEWGRGKTPFPLIKSKVRVKGGYHQSFWGPLALFLIFHECMSKGAPLFLGNGHLGFLS
jgi:hypothetical protein